MAIGDGADGVSDGMEGDAWSGGFGSMKRGTGKEVRSLAMVDRGRRRRRKGSRKVKVDGSSVRYSIPNRRAWMQRKQVKR